MQDQDLTSTSVNVAQATTTMISPLPCGMLDRDEKRNRRAKRCKQYERKEGEEIFILDKWGLTI